MKLHILIEHQQSCMYNRFCKILTFRRKSFFLSRSYFCYVQDFRQINTWIKEQTTIYGFMVIAVEGCITSKNGVWDLCDL